MCCCRPAISSSWLLICASRLSSFCLVCTCASIPIGSYGYCLEPQAYSNRNGEYKKYMFWLSWARASTSARRF